ncbi:MAG: nitroreductase family protein [Bradymonadales bacterium]|nr:nitroreductase family protein [Bradymonadales bacterium]
MRKDDGSLNLKGEVTPLMQVLLKRRSVRKYGEGAASDDQVAHILECVDRFRQVAGFERSRIVILGDEPRFKAVIKAAMAGLVGKMNPWLALTRARHLILAGAVYPPDGDRAETELAIKQAAMTMQVAILAATEVGLATCWMAGINHDRVELEYPLADGARLIAISALGLPPRRIGVSWDAMMYHLVSKRRKPLEEIWMEERWSDL